MKFQLTALFLIFIFLTQTVYGMGHKRIWKMVHYTKSPDDHLIFSNLDFTQNGYPIIHYADLSMGDPLSTCPLETMPEDLEKAVELLVGKMRDSVSKIKDAQGDHCAGLKQQISSSSSQIGTAFNNQFLASAPAGTTTASQNIINQQTQQATAVNALLLTASNMFQWDCIQAIDDKVVIQKLIGQVIMLSGLFMAGWQGLGVAAGGLLIGSLPIFQNDVDKALLVFQKYAETNQRGSFLCLYRQMLKMSVLLFANQDHQIVQGLDTSFQTGPVKTTIDSIEKIKKENPDALEDVNFLQKIRQSSEDLVQNLEAVAQEKKGPLELIHELEQWCSKNPIAQIQSSLHEPAARAHINLTLESLKDICTNLLSYRVTVRSLTEVQKIELDAYWYLKNIRKYYQNIVNDPSPPSQCDAKTLSEIAKTSESMNYFKTLKKSVDQFRDPDSGNQARVNYSILVENLGSSLAKNSYQSLMKANNKILTQHSIGNQTPIHDISVRQRTLRAMLDLCQVFDPTLTRLYIDLSEKNPVNQVWISHCAGPRSSVCRSVLHTKEEGKILGDLKYQAYFHSLCGKVSVKSGFKGGLRSVGAPEESDDDSSDTDLIKAVGDRSSAP